MFFVAFTSHYFGLGTFFFYDAIPLFPLISLSFLLFNWIDFEYKTYEKVPIRRTFLTRVREFLNCVQEPLPRWPRVQVPTIFFNQNIFWRWWLTWPPTSPLKCLPTLPIRRLTEVTDAGSFWTELSDEAQLWSLWDSLRDFVDIPCVHKTSMSKVTQSLPPNIEFLFLLLSFPALVAIISSNAWRCVNYIPANSRGEFLGVYRGPKFLVDRFCCRWYHSINWFGCYFNFGFRIVSCGHEHPAAPLRPRKFCGGGTELIFVFFKILNWILINGFTLSFAWLSTTPLDFPYMASLRYTLFSFKKYFNSAFFGREVRSTFRLIN